MKYLTIELVGGLGNQLFGLAASDHISKRKNYTFYLKTLESPKTVHSHKKYFESIFSNWRGCLNTTIRPTSVYHEKHLSEYNIYSISGDNVELHGYFQNYKYVEPDFCSKLVFDKSILSKYPNIGNTVFLHIRGGDYANNWLHDVKLDSNYYPSAIKQFPEGTHFSIFTNDIDYAKSKPFLNDISCSFINENELNSLFLMSQCSGGICANSTFSWWGSFLNRNRTLVWPSKFMNDPYYINGYLFPELIVLDV